MPMIHSSLNVEIGWIVLYFQSEESPMPACSLLCFILVFFGNSYFLEPLEKIQFPLAFNIEIRLLLTKNAGAKYPKKDYEPDHRYSLNFIK